MADDQAQLDHTTRLVMSHVDDLMRLKFYAAKKIWPLRDRPTPSSDDSHSETWAQWFERVYEENLEVYRERAREQNIRQRVLEYEMATYGRSPLEKKDAAA